jgi:hypothetical protein
MGVWYGDEEEETSPKPKELGPTASLNDVLVAELAIAV